MKRIAFIITILCSLLAITSCENANVTKLKKEIHSADAVCPISYGLAGDLISIKYHETDNMVLMYYSLNEEMSSHVFLKQNKENMMKQFRLSLSHETSRQMLKDMVNAKASLMIIYKTPSTGKTIKFSLPYEELKEIKDNPLSEIEVKRMILENSVAMQNSSMPTKLDEGMVLTKAAIVDHNLVYYCEMDEDLYDIKAIKKMPAELKEGMRAELKNMHTDPTTQRDLQMLNALDMGYMFRYYGKTSKEYVDVIFTSDELEKYISR
jgi:hypothetical protein